MKKITAVITAALCFVFSGCYSVFSGGTGGLVVDAESTSAPKQGIASVDIYAYTDCGARDSDFAAWKEGSAFSPAASYYGHTTTGTDGTFTLSKIVWKSYNPMFGKDADTSTLYLIFYHENYGLTKGSTLIVSDSTSDTVYKELTKVRKTTVLNITLKDVATDSNAGEPVYVSVTVPQTTEKNSDIKPKVYETNITGAGAVSITYPRWQSDEDRLNEVETQPEITVRYYQNAERVQWMACENGGESGEDYSFMNDMTDGVKRTVKGDTYGLTFYGKSTELSFPSVSGIYRSEGSELGVLADDGLYVEMTAGAEYKLNCGKVSTYSVNVGTTEKEKHGNFTGLPETLKTWTDFSYTGKTCSIPVKLRVLNTDGTEKAFLETQISSDQSSISVTIR